MAILMPVIMIFLYSYAFLLMWNISLQSYATGQQELHGYLDRFRNTKYFDVTHYASGYKEMTRF
jgi:hypothetical protein